MIEKLAKIKKYILILLTTVFLVLWVIHAIFGNSVDKIKILILTLVFPIMIYYTMRLLFKIIGTYYSDKLMQFFYYQFFILCLLTSIWLVIYYFNNFPNGLSPSLGVCFAIIYSVLKTVTDNRNKMDEGTVCKNSNEK